MSIRPLPRLIGAVVAGLLTPLTVILMFIPAVGLIAYLLFRLLPLIYALIFLIAALRRRTPILKALGLAVVMGLIVWASGWAATAAMENLG